MYIIIPILAIAAMVAAAIWARRCERRRMRRDWNRGRCGACGHRWQLTHHIVLGDRLYYCDHCRRYLWVSAGIDEEDDQ